MGVKAVAIAVAACAALIAGASAPCLAKAAAEEALRIEVKLTSGKVVQGRVLGVGPDSLVVHRGGRGSTIFYDPKVTIRRSDIEGIRISGGDAFLPWPAEVQTLDQLLLWLSPPASTARQITLRAYDRLPLMAVAIAGGVFTGDRLSRASAEGDLARMLEAMAGSKSSADELRDSARSHRRQAIFGAAVGLAALVLACIPSHLEVPLPTVSVEESGRVGIGFSVPLPIGSASARLLFTAQTR